MSPEQRAWRPEPSGGEASWLTDELLRVGGDACARLAGALQRPSMKGLSPYMDTNALALGMVVCSYIQAAVDHPEWAVGLTRRMRSLDPELQARMTREITASLPVWTMEVPGA